MARLILFSLLMVIFTFYFPVSSSPYRDNNYYQNRYQNRTYRSYGGRNRYSSRRSRYRTTTSSYDYDSYDSYPSYKYPPPRSYPPYQEHKAEERLRSPQPQSFFSFLPDLIPKSFKNYVDKTVTQAKDVVEDIIKSQEETVVSFLNQTLQQGEQIASSLLTEIEREIKNKTDDNKHAFINALSDFEDKLFSGPDNMINIWENTTQRNSSSNHTVELVELKKKFAEFENKVSLEVEQEKKLPSELKTQLIKFITVGRQAMKDIGSEEEAFWEKIRQMEKEVYQFKLDLADSSEGLKDTLNSLFDSLQKVELPSLDNLEEDIVVYEKKPKTLTWLTNLFSPSNDYPPPGYYPPPPPPQDPYSSYPRQQYYPPPPPPPQRRLFPSYNSSAEDW